MLSLPKLTRIHDRFLSLICLPREQFGDTLAGKLLLRSGFDADGVALVVAASVAGAASLCVDADGERLREGLRAGLIDFVVANLDEALRILKNEVRRALPVSVGLIAEPESSIAAMIERGLQPDLLSGIAERQAGEFTERGAVAVPDENVPDQDTSLIEWTVAKTPGRPMARIAPIAAEALDHGRSDTAARRRWLQQSPRYLGRAFGARECLRMTGAEAAMFSDLVRKKIPSAAIALDGQRI